MRSRLVDEADIVLMHKLSLYAKVTLHFASIIHFAIFATVIFLFFFTNEIDLEMLCSAIFLRKKDLKDPL